MECYEGTGAHLMQCQTEMSMASQTDAVASVVEHAKCGGKSCGRAARGGQGRAGQGRAEQGRGGEGRGSKEKFRDRCLQLAGQLRVPDRVVQCSVYVHVPNRPCFKATTYTEGQKPVSCLPSLPSNIGSCELALVGNCQQLFKLLCLGTHATTGL